MLEETRVLAVEPDQDPVVVETDRGRLLAERVVITAGAWLARLVPALAPRVAVSRQHVGYFRLGGEPGGMAVGRFPVWVYLGDAARGLYYGLPEFGRPGVKAALHAASGRADDPDASPGVDAAEIERVRRFLATQLAVPVEAVVHAENCLYTNTPDENFLLGALPGHPNVVVGSACSGHGFKFGPLTGRLLADLVMDGRTSVADFERVRESFALARE